MISIDASIFGAAAILFRFGITAYEAFKLLKFLLWYQVSAGTSSLDRRQILIPKLSWVYFYLNRVLRTLMWWSGRFSSFLLVLQVNRWRRQSFILDRLYVSEAHEFLIGLILDEFVLWYLLLVHVVIGAYWWMHVWLIHGGTVVIQPYRWHPLTMGRFQRVELLRGSHVLNVSI